jgi:CheY-like chemotaxis protein
LTAPSPTAAHVLVVDDDDIVRDVVAEQLKELGFAVSVASSGIEAMAVLAEPATVDVLTWVRGHWAYLAGRGGPKSLI